MQSQELPTLVEQLQALKSQVGNQYFNVHSTIHRKCEINEILHSIWTMEVNIHASYIVLLRKGLLKILCGGKAAEIF